MTVLREVRRQVLSSLAEENKEESLINVDKKMKCLEFIRCAGTGLKAERPQES